MQKHILVVCTGNTCRSPMAAQLLAHALAAAPSPLSGIKVVSAGIAAQAGDPASPNSREAMRRVGLDLSRHKARMLDGELLAASALVLAMTDRHRAAIREWFPEYSGPVFLFREFMDGDLDVPDPFGGNLQCYLDTRDSLAEAIPSILNYLQSKNRTP